MDIPKAIADLRSVSPDICEYLDMELHLHEFQDRPDFTPRDLLSVLYLLAIDEMTTIGLSINMDPEDLSMDFYMAELIYCLLYVTNRDTLAQYITTNGMCDKLESLLESDDDQSSIISNIIEYFHHTYPHEPQLIKLMEYPELISNDMDGLFIEHINTILLDISEKLNTVKLPDMDDLDLKYLKYINLRRKLAREASSRIMSYEKINPVEQEVVESLMVSYDADKIQPRVLHIYACVDREGGAPDSLPDEIYDPASGKVMSVDSMYADNFNIHHKINSEHHINYWYVSAKERPSVGQLIALVSHHYMPRDRFSEDEDNAIFVKFDESKSEEKVFWEDIEHMIEKAPKNLFGDFEIENIRVYANWLYGRSE